MKKVYLLIIFVFLINLNTKIYKEEYVFNYVDDNIVKTIDLIDYNITTKNIKKYLTKDLNIIYLEYKLPDIYLFQKKSEYYNTNGIDIDICLKNIEKSITLFLEKNSNKSLIQNIYFNGIKINTIKVSGSKNSIKLFESRMY